MSGDQEVRKTGSQEVKKSGCQDVRMSRCQEVRKSGSQEVKKSGCHKDVRIQEVTYLSLIFLVIVSRTKSARSLAERSLLLGPTASPRVWANWDRIIDSFLGKLG